MSTRLEKMTHDLLADRLRMMGFAPVDRLSFSRPIDDREQLIGVPSRTEGGKLKFTCTVGVRFGNIRTPFCPIHFLSPERKYYEWEGGNEEELAIAADGMIEEIHEVGLDFFDRFATLEAIEEELVGSAVSEFFVVAPHQRTGILAAIALTRGERAKAESLFAEALHDARNERAGKRRLIEDVRKELLGK